jgi:hypothetical protein
MFFWQNIVEPSMTHPATRCINLSLNLQNKFDIKERGQRTWCHRFMFAHKSVLHLSSERALSRMAKILSFHNNFFCLFIIDEEKRFKNIDFRKRLLGRTNWLRSLPGKTFFSSSLNKLECFFLPSICDYG